jgi:hypothetical protein
MYLQVKSETSRPQDHMDESGERCSDGGVGNALITAQSRNVITLMRHMLILVLRVTHRLHPRGLELSMFALRIWRCIDYLHLRLLINVLHTTRLPEKGCESSMLCKIWRCIDYLHLHLLINVLHTTRLHEKGCESSML